MEEISRYLCGEMDDFEKTEFEHKIHLDSALRDEFMEAKEVWDQMENLIAGSVDEINTDGAWQKVNNRILKDDEEVQLSSPSFYQMPIMLKWAASILIVVGLAWLSYIMWLQPTGSPMLVFENTDQQLISVKTLQDGSLIYLAQTSTIQYPQQFSNNERSIQLSGEAFFDVAHDDKKPFRIKAGNANIEVLGTSFNVKTHDANSLELFVETGKVKVSMSNSPTSTYVEAGQLLTLTNGSAKVVNTSAYNTLWRKNILQFRDERLEDIFYGLGKTYGYILVAENEELNNRLMTLTIYDGSLKTISELIALSLSVEYELKSDSLVVFRNSQ